MSNNQETKKCKNCGKDIPKNAKECPHCKKDLRNSIEKNPILTVVLIVVIILMGHFLFGGKDDSSSGGSNNSISSSDNSSAAYVQSKNFIRAALKSPSTADFPFIDFTANNLGNNRYEVRSYVDSQNSLGAEIRSNWVVVLQYQGGEEGDQRNWKLEKMVINDEQIYP